MGVGSIPDSPPMPAGETAEERERAWTAAHPPTAQNNSYDTNVRPQQQYSQPPQQQHFQPPQQPYTTYGGQGLYPQPVEGIFVRGEVFLSQFTSSARPFAVAVRSCLSSTRFLCVL